MQRIIAVKKARLNASNSAGAECTVQALTESEAAEVMRLYYRDNKAQLITDIKEYRSSILCELMRGIPVEQVFVPFVRPAEPASACAAPPNHVCGRQIP